MAQGGTYSSFTHMHTCGGWVERGGGRGRGGKVTREKDDGKLNKDPEIVAPSDVAWHDDKLFRLYYSGGTMRMHGHVCSMYTTPDIVCVSINMFCVSAHSVYRMLWEFSECVAICTMTAIL